jgi:hypothetical protein
MSFNASSCPSGEALFELRFNLSGTDVSLPIDAVFFGNVTRQTMFALTQSSNGGVLHSFERDGEYVGDDGSLDASLCLPTDGCYGLVDYTGVWPADVLSDEKYRLRWNGTDLTGLEQSVFPYYLQPSGEGDYTTTTTTPNWNVTTSTSTTAYPGLDSEMFFTEFGNGCSVSCSSDETLYEVQMWAGNTGASHSWRIEGAGGQELLGCDDDGNYCGESYDVLVTRACLPAEAASCRRFVFGHPNLVVPERYFVSDRNDGFSVSVAGLYNPRFTVKVNGSIVSDSTHFNTGLYTPANFEAVEIGTGCPKCPDDNPALLEVFAYRTLQSPPLSISLADALDSASSLQNMSISSSALQYARQCLPSSQCYNLQVSFPEIQNQSYYESIPTVIKLDSVYFAHQEVVLSSSSTRYNDSVIVGEGCAKETACAGDESLVSVKIDTSNQQDDMPAMFGSWVLYDTYDTSNLPEFFWPNEFSRSFDRGYLAGSEFQHFLCVPSNASLSFGMFDSIPLAVTWSVEKDGQELTCRQTSEGSIKVISTNLDGSCPSTATLSAGAIAGIAISAAVAAALIAFLAWRCYRRGRAMAPMDAQGGAVARPKQAGQTQWWDSIHFIANILL